jgi:phosphoribosylaminoimidazole-succinocarboxamide synthase
MKPVQGNPVVPNVECQGMVFPRETIVAGVSKTLYEHSAPGTGLLCFRDADRPGDESAPWRGRSMVNAGLSALLMQRMALTGLGTHFVRMHSSREHVVKLVDPLPVTLSVHNVVSRPFGKRLGMAEGTPLSRNIVECHLKDHALGYPLITQEHALSFSWCSINEWDDVMHMASRVNDFLIGQFSAMNLELVSFRVEFGRLCSPHGDDWSLVLCDEISLDTCYLRDTRTGFVHRPCDDRHTSGAIHFGQEVARRFGILTEAALGSCHPFPVQDAPVVIPFQKP